MGKPRRKLRVTARNPVTGRRRRKATAVARGGGASKRLSGELSAYRLTPARGLELVTATLPTQARPPTRAARQSAGAAGRSVAGDAAAIRPGPAVEAGAVAPVGEGKHGAGPTRANPLSKLVDRTGADQVPLTGRTAVGRPRKKGGAERRRKVETSRPAPVTQRRVEAALRDTEAIGASTGIVELSVSHDRKVAMQTTRRAEPVAKITACKSTPPGRHNQRLIRRCGWG